MEGSDTTVTMSPNESSNNLERIFSVDHAEDIAQPQCPGKGGTISNHEALGGATFSIHDVNAPTQSETVPLWPVNNDRGPLDSSLNAPPIAGLNENHPPGNTQFDEYLKQQSGLEDDYSLNSFSTQGGAATMNGDANAMSNEMTQPGSLNKNLPALSLDDSEYAEGSPQNITREEQVAQGEDEGRVHLAKNCANGETSSKRSHQPLEVIDLLDESDDDEASDDTATLIEQALPTKRPRFHKVAAPAEASSQLNAGVASSVALASYHARAANLPSWMDQHTGVATAIERVYQPEQPMSALMNSYYPAPTDTFQRPLPAPIDFRQNQVLNQPHYLSYPPNFKPTWALLVPPPPQKIAPLQQPAGAASLGQVKVYQLSLLNVNEFTIEGVSPRFGMPLTSISGLRVPIRQISRTHGKSVYQRDNDGGEGKWRIPLGAYHEFAGFLRSESNTQVLGIPPNQLQIASLERERQEKGYPTPDQLIDYGVPKGLANALAPFQRGGVDFVKEKGGRALIADDMGLGKTIQAVASMSIYHKEWPVLVLCPSGARYHWENEFKQWLGVDSAVNKSEKNTIDKIFPDSRKKSSIGPLLQDWQINVLTSSKSPILPYEDTRVVICSYGLSSFLIESGKIVSRIFRCAIVDESHMLKNKATKRTSTLLPILNATDRCVLLSGTPALARPLELWPQLAILGTEQHGWGGDEQDFIDKYVKNGNARRSAELHTMLRGTVMIRRLKNDILKTMPRKVREKAEVHVVSSPAQRSEFKDLMTQLRDGKGALGKLARIYQTAIEREAEQNGQAFMPEENEHDGKSKKAVTLTSTTDKQKMQAKVALHSEVKQRLADGQSRIQQAVDQRASHLDLEYCENIGLQMEGKLRVELENYYKERMQQIESEHAQQADVHAQQLEHAENKRTTLLSRLYGLTGNAKIPLVVDSLQRWLRDPTKGKICIFAHHISVLNAIRDCAGLSNDSKSSKKFIRIDGSTLPRHRQEQINAFQNDPSIRVALLGITAAGVAVTLTASSTVWFAELFWTPAIMIQAEDRCHRIGQSARVKCLYFVARGTLDDVLWKLLEKKFRDLGEFVEGQEKLKLVVDTVYKSAKAIQSSLFDISSVEDSVDDHGTNDADLDQELQLDGDLVHDIEELGEEEQRMLYQGDPDADETDGEGAFSELELKMPAKDNFEESCLGRSEDDAIALSDDDDESTENEKPGSSLAYASNEADESEQSQLHDQGSVDRKVSANDPYDLLGDSRLYRIIFGDTALGLEVTLYERRIVVAKISPERQSRLGVDSKPAVGDIFASISGHSLGLITSLSATLLYLKRALQTPPVELMFVEAPVFIEAFQKQSLSKAVEKANSQQSVARSQNPSDVSSSPIDVIDLLFDD